MHGLEGLKAEFIQDQKTRDAAGIKKILFERIREDKELRHPRVKILNHLAAQYDFNKDLFMEVNFSRLVKDCMIGKNKAKEYFDLLIKKDLIESRTDGYRVYYRMGIIQ